MKICKDCGVAKPLAEFYQAKSRNTPMSYCKTCMKIRANKWKEDNPEKHAAAQKKSRRKNKYGLSDEDIKIVESINFCEICHSTDNLVVDHCHDRLIYRGVLCSNCNTAIGMARNSVRILEEMIVYLKERG